MSGDRERAVDRRGLVDKLDKKIARRDLFRLSGGAVAIALLATGRKGRKATIPFGPFLALGGVISLLWGRPLLAWYLGG